MTADIDRRAWLAAAAGVVFAARASAQTPAARPRVLLTTADGPITLELAAEKAPVTCANFLRYVDAGRFDGMTFYRALKILADPLTGLVQGGIRAAGAPTFPPIAHESTRTTGLGHVDGTLSMARFAPGTATSEFFICVGDIPSLDADPSQSGDNEGFAAVGRVVDGMDTVKAILRSPISPTKGEGGMVGQMLDPEVTIVSARRV